MEGLAERLAAVRARIERAAERSRRDPARILLLAVSKIFPAEAIQEAYALGLRESSSGRLRRNRPASQAILDVTRKSATWPARSGAPATPARQLRGGWGQAASSGNATRRRFLGTWG